MIGPAEQQLSLRIEPGKSTTIQDTANPFNENGFSKSGDNKRVLVDDQAECTDGQ